MFKIKAYILCHVSLLPNFYMFKEILSMLQDLLLFIYLIASTV